MKPPLRRGIPLRTVAPNAVTALALCSGLSAVRFAIGGDWQLALAAIVTAGVLDGLDGRIARMLKGESRFGAELDSLSDVIAFGVAPALVPHKSAGFLTGVPAPAAAGLALLPIYLWLITGHAFFRSPFVTAPWLGIVGFLMISSVATYSWSSLRLRRNVRFEALAGVAVLFGALFSAPWETLTGICAVYLALIPLSIRSYAKVRRLRATAAASESSPA